ncbi:GNAT family N-acetyltransferase [Actinophytocola sp.]|uniref:GNAT family N-acetyltransferase n=1 Tax=Actinophytocola sp. TaxID=1872138 RepID=UPI002D31EAFD|nr:GNAT family N-acetyltransferase [Actinophytocola sp.]HYQ69292.1 GNAT family N-acetyltransferase [Actinophytocola sp.]
METRRLTGDDWRTLRDVRLAALADAPYAYGSTLAVEQAFDESTWRDRIDTTPWVLAVRNAENAGLVDMYLSRPETPMLIAMWVSPVHRGRGVGDALVAEILRWAGEKSWSRVLLRVADGNAAARRLFLRHGFTPTGRRAPLESDPGVRTEILSRAL